MSLFNYWDCFQESIDNYTMRCELMDAVTRRRLITVYDYSGKGKILERFEIEEQMLDIFLILYRKPSIVKRLLDQSVSAMEYKPDNQAGG